MEKYILSYEGREYSFGADNEMKKYLKENGIEKKLGNNIMMCYNYSYTEKTCTIKIIKKF